MLIIDLEDGRSCAVRPSGTEPVVRVMVEGRDATEVQTLCGELADFLPATAAGRHQRVAAADHAQLGDPSLARADHRRERRGFGAPALWIGGVLDVAAAVNATARAADRGADREPRVGGIEQCRVHAQRSLTKGTPIAFGGIALPMKPASSTTVNT